MYGDEIDNGIVYGTNYISAEQINEIYKRYSIPFQIETIKEFDELNTYIAENFFAKDGESGYRESVSDIAFLRLCAVKVMFKSRKQYYYFLHLIIEFAEKKGKKESGI